MRAAAIPGRLGQLDRTLTGGRFSRNLQSTIRAGQALAAEVGSVAICRLVMMPLIPSLPVVAVEGPVVCVLFVPKFAVAPEFAFVAVTAPGSGALGLGLNVRLDSRAGHRAAAR